MIPRFEPSLGMGELAALLRPHRGAVARFEQAFAKTFGAADAVAFPYGRSALWAFLQAVGLTDAEVLMPAYTCSVVAHAVSLSGNRPRFVDIRLSDYNMDLDRLAEAITPNTHAIVATHLFGYPLDLDRLEAIVADAERRYGHKVWLIQDCAHSFGADWKGRLVGTSGDVGLYALNISKMITAIFGGMLTFQDQDLADRVRRWRDAHFVAPSPSKPWWRRLYLVGAYLAFRKTIYTVTWFLQERTPFLNKLTKSYHLDGAIHFPPDFNERMLDVEAAVGLVQLEKYRAIVERRRTNAKLYSRHLLPREDWIPPPIVSGATYSHYVVRVPDRNAVISDLGRRGVQLGELIQYSVPELPPYRNGDNCQNSRMASLTTVNLPTSTDQAHVVIKGVKEFLSG